MGEKATSNKQKVTSNEQKVTSNEQKVTSNEQKVTSNEQKKRATNENKQQRATSKNFSLKIFKLWFLFKKCVINSKSVVNCFMTDVPVI